MSHAKMGVFWSSTDDSTINTCFGGADWILSIVGNHKGEYKARVDMYNPFRFKIDDLKIRVVSLQDSPLRKAVEDEIRLKVKRKVYTYQGGYGGYRQGEIWKDGKWVPAASAGTVPPAKPGTAPQPQMLPMPGASTAHNPPNRSYGGVRIKKRYQTRTVSLPS